MLYEVITEQLGGEDVSSPSHGEFLDDPGVAARDDEDGDDRGDRDENRQGGVPPECEERLLRAVGGGGYSVRPEADPCEESYNFV